LPCTMDNADYFQNEVEEEEHNEKNIRGDEDISIEKNFHIGTEKESVCDNGDVDENVEEVRDAPHFLRDHRLEPTRENENRETIERHDAKGEREGIKLVGPERNKHIGK